MIDLYYWPTPNGHKITLFLEEAGLPYTVKPVDIGKGDQFRPEFLALSPNNKIPAIIDHAPADGGAPLSLPPAVAARPFLFMNLGLPFSSGKPAYSGPPGSLLRPALGLAFGS